MFRYTPEENHNLKLVCTICNFKIYDIPIHCSQPMKWKLSSSFRKVQLLSCRVCSHTISMPIHCNVPMIYSESDYRDLPEITELDLKAMHEAYGSSNSLEKRDEDVSS